MALRFNGTNGSKAQTLAGALGAVSGGTVCVVGKVTTDRNAYSTFFDIGLTDAGDKHFCAQTDTDGVTLVFFDYTGKLHGTGPAMVVGAYYGVAFTTSGTGISAAINMYWRRIDDPAAATGSTSSTGYGNATYTGNWGAFSLGETNFNEPLNGTVENAQVFDRVLSQAEIENTWFSRMPAARPVRWFPVIADTLADSYRDFAGVGNLATVGTAPTAESGGPIPWSAGLGLPQGALEANLTQSITFDGITSSGTGTVDIVGTSTTTFADMTSSATGTVDVVGTGATTFDGMTSAATATADIAGVQAATFEGITSSGEGTTGGTPAPAPAPSTNVASGLKRRASPSRIGIRVDGRLYFVTYQEAADILARQAELDARKRRAEKSRRAAKIAARLAAQELKARLTIEQPFEMDGIEDSLIADRMFRDLRSVYSDRLSEMLTQLNPTRRQIDDQAAMAAAEFLLN